MCGIAGVYGHENAARLVHVMLSALQHRGEDSAGIVSSWENKLIRVARKGLVNAVFTETHLRRLSGLSAIGHNRYATSGDGRKANFQPIVTDQTSASPIALVHNGDLLKEPTKKLRAILREEGISLHGTTDSEVAHALIVREGLSLIDSVTQVLKQICGAYCFLVMNPNEMIAVRDPIGFRPMWKGRIGSGFAVASEDRALFAINARNVCEVLPGELVHFSSDGALSIYPLGYQESKWCVFELVYFAHPESTQFGHSVHDARESFGKRLAIESRVDADVVLSVPDSGNKAALAFAYQADIPFKEGITRSHYVGRSFIQPNERSRRVAVEQKLSIVRSVVAGKRVIVVDDSIVRGMTMRILVEMLRSAGAKEVHIRISSPPATHPCLYGIDTPTQAELLAANWTVEEMCEKIGADSLAFLSLEGMLGVLQGADEDTFCRACFTGNYPLLPLTNITF